MRIREIDDFRGLSIVLMVFFTMILRLSDSLPDFLIHNVPNSLHLGDFVLPMFLFASGMSIVFYAKKRASKTRAQYALDVIERVGLLVLVWIFISPLSSGEVLGMDELMLSVILFIPSLALSALPEEQIAAVAIAPMISYVILNYLGMLPNLTIHYLGGYQAAIFYLPVMLAGVIAGKRLDDLNKLVLISAIVTLLFLAVVPPYKMSASPSFMAFAITLSLIVFILIKRIRLGFLEYLGRTPLRYWAMMWYLVLLPMGMYVLLKKIQLPLSFSAPMACLISIVAMIFLYAASKVMDMVVYHLNKSRAGAPKKG